MSKVSLLSPEKDPLGKALLNHLEGEPKGEITVMSDLAIDDVIPVPYLFRSYEEMPEWETQALKLVYGRVLDLGAGAGVHSLYLQEKGFEVLPVDISPGAVEVMKRRGLPQAQQARLQDLGDENFDTIFLMMNGIGIVGDLDGLERFLEDAHTYLKPGGQILFDSSDLIYLYAQEISLDGEMEFRIPFPEDKYYGIIEYQMGYKGIMGDPFLWLYVDFPRVEKLAHKLGYKIELIYRGTHYEYLCRLSI